jgi:sugar O-acyltransferase (sialic acid O-acetyltransferase NeuD family)
VSAPRPLLLVGAGGFARETAAAVRAVNDIRPQWTMLGFLDDDPARHGTLVDGLCVLGPVEAVHGHPDAAVLVCTGSPRNYRSRRDIVRRLGLPAQRYAVLRHPAASVAAGTEIGPGSVLLAGTVVTTPQPVGAHVAAMPQAVLTHDDTVGDYVTLASRVALGGGVRVAEGAYLGAGSLIREGLTVGAWALVGMGSVVLRDIPPGEVWAGAPARRLRRSEGLPVPAVPG